MVGWEWGSGCGLKRESQVNLAVVVLSASCLWWLHHESTHVIMLNGNTHAHVHACKTGEI